MTRAVPCLVLFAVSAGCLTPALEDGGTPPPIDPASPSPPTWAGPSENPTTEGTPGEDGAGGVSVPQPEPAFSVERLDGPGRAVEENERFTMTARVSNAGDADGYAAVRLQVDGRAVDVKSAFIRASQAVNVEFAVTIADAGDHEVRATVIDHDDVGRRAVVRVEVAERLTAPMLTYPPAGATEAPWRALSLKWEPAEYVGPGRVAHVLEVDPTPAERDCGARVDACEIRDLAGDTLYRWRVVASTTTGLEEASPWYDFTTSTRERTFWINEPPSYLDAATAAAVDDAIRRAILSWDGLNGYDVRITTGGADVQTDYVKDYGLGEHIGIAYGNGVIQVGLGNTACNGEWTQFSIDYIYAIARHEAGHAMGLPHSDDITDIMYPQIQGLDYATPCELQDWYGTVKAGDYEDFAVLHPETRVYEWLADADGSDKLELCLYEGSDLIDCSDPTGLSEGELALSGGVQYTFRVECDNWFADCGIRWHLAWRSLPEAT